MAKKTDNLSALFFFWTQGEIFMSLLTELGTFFSMSTQTSSSSTSPLNIGHLWGWVTDKRRAITKNNKIPTNRIYTFWNGSSTWSAGSWKWCEILEFWDLEHWSLLVDWFTISHIQEMLELNSDCQSSQVTIENLKLWSLHTFMPSVVWLTTDYFSPSHTGDTQLSPRRQGEDRHFQKETLAAALSYFLFHVSPSKIC